MSFSSWTNLKGHLQGDISYDLKRVLVNSVYVDFDLVTFGEKWTKVDIAFEYRLTPKENWRTDAVIISTTADYLRENKLYGLTASKYGTTNSLRWKYSENNLFYSDTPEIRLRVLPRIRTFGSANSTYSISSAYGDSLVDLNAVTSHKCIGIDNNGRYMCVDSSSFYIMDSLNDASRLYSYSGVLNPNFAIHINSGNYIVSDSGNNRILELNSTLTSALKVFSMGGF